MQHKRVANALPSQGAFLNSGISRLLQSTIASVAVCQRRREHAERSTMTDAFRIGSVNDRRLLRFFTSVTKKPSLIVTAKLPTSTEYHPRQGGSHFRQLLHVLSPRRRDAALYLAPLGLAPQSPGFPGAITAATKATVYDSDLKFRR